MGCTRPFFCPYLSQDGADKLSITSYFEKLPKFRKHYKDVSGRDKHLAFLIFNDTHFNKEDIPSAVKYNYFEYRKTTTPRTVQSFHRRVMNLCSKVILRDASAPDKYLRDIYGYTPRDLMEMDYATFADLAEMVEDMADKNEAEMHAKMTELQNLNNQPPR